MQGSYITNQDEIVLGTINYSGILNSPFEFFSQESYQEEEQISHCFKVLLQQKEKVLDKNKFKWNLGKIDQKIQKDRYAPIYRSMAGLQKGKLINQDTFREIWRIEIEKALKKIKFQPTEQQINNCQNFDLHCYRAFLFFLYKIKDLSQAPHQNPQTYINFMNKYYSKSFLDEKEKFKKTITTIKSEGVDILFIQEASQYLIEQLRMYPSIEVFQNVSQTGKSSSIILVRKNKFQKIFISQNILKSISSQLVKQLNLNQDSSFCCVDDYFFLCVHLSSKAEKNGPQVKNMIESINKLKAHQKFKNLKLIVGGDINSYLSPDLAPQLFIFPNRPDITTTMKKRTWVQPQVNKAEQQIFQCKDSIISTVPLLNPRVVTINNLSSKQVKYIPNHEHPFDHFVVMVNISNKA